MTLVEAWQVFARYVLNNSPVWTEPVALLLMSAAMMFGAAAGVRSESHFGFFLTLHVSPPRIRAVLLAVARLVVAAIGLVPLPQGLYFLPIGLGGALIAMFALERLITLAPLARVEH
jgi:TRAP-type C4-dicarboxylate transport system permease small subunit